MNHAITQTNRLIRIRDVMALTGLSKSYIYQLCENQQFPNRVHLVKGGTSVAWLASEVNEWIEQRITERNQNQ